MQGLQDPVLPQSVIAMPVDYSKWDALELSDDSDIEVHPNVDKRSFIRAKQNQIHQQRHDRKHRITTLRYERVINEGLLIRIDALLASLEAHKAEAEAARSADDVDEVIFDALTDVNANGSLGKDKPPSPPEGVHTQEQQPSYSKMMGALVDQVKAEIKSSNIESRYTSYISGVKSHQSKVTGLQQDLMVELTNLEKEEGSKITSESIHTGFNSTHIAKTGSTQPSASTSQPSTKSELLNPDVVSKPASTLAGTANDDDEEADMETSALAKQFAALPLNNFQASLGFISTHPEVLNEKETDGLLVEAFNAQQAAKTKKEEDYARHCVHQALLLQYCRQLGKDGVGLFFKRIQTQGHQARKLFLDDVNTTYARIRTRTAELNKMKDEDNGEKEQIQLHAVEPGTTINILTPPPFEHCTTDDERESRKIFEAFPKSLQDALVSGSLDAVNEVLGKMKVAEAEMVVEQLSNGGMLSLEGGVIDATTEEGRRHVEEIEGRGASSAGAAKTQALPEEDVVLSVDQVD